MMNKLTLEQRISRLEKLLKIKTEGMHKLPNGALIDKVSDVLSAWAGVSRRDARGAIRKLDAVGALDKATNRFYPTSMDVADAIEECWDDIIGNGDGTAKLFVRNYDGADHYVLNLYPIMGGISRARNIVLKFDWPDDQEMDLDF